MIQKMRKEYTIWYDITLRFSRNYGFGSSTQYISENIHPINIKVWIISLYKIMYKVTYDFFDISIRSTVIWTFKVIIFSENRSLDFK